MDASSSDDDEESFNSFDAREQNLAEQLQREAHEEEELLAAGALQQQFSNAHRLFDRNTQILCDCSIRQFYRLEMALEHVSDPRRRHMVVFARDRPKLSGDRLVFVKQYLTGLHHNFFRYASLASTVADGVTLDEVVRSEDPNPMYFDIEIKQRCMVGAVGNPKTILEAHCSAHGLGLNEDEIEHLADGYCEAAILPFSEDECAAGVLVMKTYLSTVLSELIESFRGGFIILSGCRAEKFSIHVICTYLFCDGSYLSAPLLAFEVARRFGNWNINWLRSTMGQDVSPEHRFRLRALMVDDWCSSMEVTVVGESISQRPKFTGLNDTPFDEGVYTRNHLMRAPGATKAGSNAPALVPICEGGRVMNQCRDFARIFPMTDDGKQKWETHLITRPFSPNDHTVVIAGWTPSLYYPQRRGWNVNSVAHPRFLSDLEGQFQTVAKECACDRYVETRFTGRDYAAFDPTNPYLRVNRTLGAESVPKEPISADDLFVAEDGTMKAFKFFKPNDFIRHDHGHGVEANASARVFPGGFRCFVCQVTYGVPEEVAEEAPFHCGDMETVSFDDPLAQIPLGTGGIDWERATEKKWFVVQAPMGSGKTEQLVSFMANTAWDRNWRVLVVSFRQYLASQQSRRLGTHCYLALTNDRLMTSPSPLTICLNSLWKLGDLSYDAILLDEAGLIRRHFMSSTVTSVLVSVYERFCNLIRRAEFVVMLQASLSQEDVQFYTEIDGVQAEDSNRIAAFTMTKPVKIHPIQWTTECFQCFSNMVECYKKAFDEFGCKQPFMVFCSQCNFAEYIVEYLRDVAKTVDGADPVRIKGIWASLKNKQDPFCLRFVHDAGVAAAECDVLVCTSVIGAGFSVSRHFPSFHAFLFNNILDHQEEQQFIQRLRVKLDDVLRDGVSRDSYMFVEKGHGNAHTSHVNVIRQDFNKVRLLMTSDEMSSVSISGVSVMKNTQAQVEVERAVTRSKHDTLWIEWGLSVESPFEKFPDGSEEDKKLWVEMKKEFMKRNSKKRLDIADMIRAEYDEMGLSEFLAAIEIGGGLTLFRALASEEQIKTLENGFSSRELATRLIDCKFTDKKQRDKILGGKTQLRNITRSAWRLAQWITRVYKDICPERTGSFFDHVKNKPFSKTYMQLFSLYNLAEAILQPMLSDPNSTSPFLLCPGTTPFFNGLRFILHPSICEDMKRRLEGKPDDDIATKKFLDEMRVFVRTYMAEHNARDSYLLKLYSSTTDVRNLIKKVFKGLGLQVCNPSRKRIMLEGERFYVYETTTPSVDFALMLAAKYTQSNVLGLLSTLRFSDNLSEPDKEWVDDGISLYNTSAHAVGLPTITLTPPHDITSFVVIPRRIQELEVERANVGFDEPPTEQEIIATRLDRERLRLAQQQAQRLEESFAEQQYIRDFIVTDAVEVDDEEELTMSLAGFDEPSRNRIANPFVLTEADDAGSCSS